ncbi:MAG: TlpA family protein disulfide reductase, partial [Actinobacteria bacterium]
MRRRLIIALAAVAVAAAACGPGSASVTTVAPSAVPEGSTAAPRTEPAPGFTVSTFDGGTFSLAEHLAADGRPVFLNLWASWCLPCREDM